MPRRTESWSRVHFPVLGKLPAVTVIQNGQCTKHQRAAPELWTIRPNRKNGEEEADWRKRFIPLRVGAVWEITRGAQKIMIRVSQRILTGGVTPLMRASDSSLDCVFPPLSVVSDSPSTLKDAWIAKGGKFAGSGVSFMSLDRIELGEYFRSITPTFHGFTRAGPSRSVSAIPEGARHLRRLSRKFFLAIDHALKEICQGRMLEYCFRLAASHREFLSKYGLAMAQGVSEKGLSTDDRLTTSLRESYNVNFNSGNKAAMRLILSFYVDCHSAKAAMELFGCTSWAVKQARLLLLVGSKLIRSHGPRITSRHRVDTAEHLQSWATSKENVLQVAHSITGNMTLLRLMNRLRSRGVYWYLWFCHFNHT